MYMMLSCAELSLSRIPQHYFVVLWLTCVPEQSSGGHIAFQLCSAGLSVPLFCLREVWHEIGGLTTTAGLHLVTTPGFEPYTRRTLSAMSCGEDGGRR